MTYHDTLDEDLTRAKRILEEGAGRPGTIYAGCTIYGKDTYAAYKLLESFVETIENWKNACTEYRPDHNAECLNCDEWADAHHPAALKAGELRTELQRTEAAFDALAVKATQIENERAAAETELQKFLQLFSDYEDPCECYADAQARFNLMKDRETRLHDRIHELEGEVERLHAYGTSGNTVATDPQK